MPNLVNVLLYLYHNYKNSFTLLTNKDKKN